MKVLLTLFLLLMQFGIARAQPPADPAQYQAGVFGDESRAVSCVSGPPGADFQEEVWAWMPGDPGLAYVTLRFTHPPQIDTSARPIFHDLVTRVIVTEFADGTSEWNLVMTGCPIGWINLFSRRCVILEETPCRIGIRGMHSMMRDCGFILHQPVEVLGELMVNEPGCETVPGGSRAWGALKASYLGNR
jgi:hypothetical protein